jgi:hypothetical protein
MEKTQMREGGWCGCGVHREQAAENGGFNAMIIAPCDLTSSESNFASENAQVTIQNDVKK